MKWKSEETSHGKGKAVFTGEFHEGVFQGDKMPGVSGKTVVANGFVCPKSGCRYTHVLSNDRY